MRSANEFYASTMRPELLAETAKFYHAAGRRDKADSLACEFMGLPPVTDPRREARSCYTMAWTAEDSSIGTAAATALAARAAAACRKAAGKVGNEGEIYAYTGYLLYRNGDYAGAVAGLEEGIAWYLARPGTPGDGLMTAWCDLGNVYRDVGLADEAFEANAEAIRLSRRQDGWLLEEMYRFRAALHAEAGRADSALHYVGQAIAATPPSARPKYLPLLESERIGYLLAAHPGRAASLSDRCLQLLHDSATLDPEPRARLRACYGETLLATPGREKEGVHEIENAYRTFLSGNDPAGIVRTGERLLAAYIRTGLSGRLASAYPRYAAVRDSLLGEQARKAAVGAAIRYRTQRREQENRLLTAEIAIKRHTLALSWTLSGFLAVLLCTGAWIVRQRDRHLRRIGEERLAQIGLLLRSRTEAGCTRPALPPSDGAAEMAGPAGGKAGPADAAGGSADRDSANIVARRDSEKVIAEVTAETAQAEIRRKLSSEVFNTDKEAEFRRSFTALHPAYLPALRRIARKLTRTDELIAMLLLLDLSNDEIGLTLGISRSGVNKARSRMRGRLGLESERKLEEFLRETAEGGLSIKN